MFNLVTLSCMLREGIAVNGEWLSHDERGIFFLFFLMHFGEVRARTVCDQSEQAS